MTTPSLLLISKGKRERQRDDSDVEQNDNYVFNRFSKQLCGVCNDKVAGLFGKQCYICRGKCVQRERESELLFYSFRLFTNCS